MSIKTQTIVTAFFALCAVIFSPHQAWDDNLGSPGMERP